jgi:hypothetical protein|tara:strand:- start:2373 stop:2678 length:306 start_codon:yes stop_codon:yes gene_type:complete
MNNDLPRSKEWNAAFELKEGLVRYDFDNGWGVSLLWHNQSYGSCNDFGAPLTYEVAVFKPDGNFLPLAEWDDVIGNKSWDEVWLILETVNNNLAEELKHSY